MGEIQIPQRRKLHQVATELNLASTTLMEYLDSLGYETSKKHMSIVTPEMYEEIVRKFDQNRWRKYQEELEVKKERSKKREAEQLRSQEIDRILKDTFAPFSEDEATVGTPADREEITRLEVEQPEVAEARQDIIFEGAKVGPDGESAPAAAEIQSAEDIVDKKVEEVSPEITAAKSAISGDIVSGIVESRFKDEILEGASVVKELVSAEDDKELEATDGVKAKDEHELVSVDDVVAEALKLARKKPKVTITQREKAVEQSDKPELAEKGRKKKPRRRKKPRRPEAPSPAAVGLEMEQRAKISKRKKKAVEPEQPVAKRKRRRAKRKKIDDREVSASIKQTLAQIEEKGKGRKKKRKTVEEETAQEDANVLKVTEYVSAQELANLMDISVNDVIKKAMEMGLLISINQRLDHDTITLLTDDLGFMVNFISTLEEEIEMDEEDVGNLEYKLRAPVVTVMGHVDHGKTSLLDYIRRSNIIAGESGGITQHIGAYKLEYDGRHITFLDTPGHEAFTAMRARGAQVTDIVVLVIAADDQVMPQTVEAINHARAAGVQIIVAINKIDKPNAQPEKVKQQLADQGILIEEWGGKYQCTEISAKYGQNVDKLMEEIILLADLLELKAPIDCRSSGVVIDSRLDKGRGAISTVLIQQGILKVGDNFVAGQFAGKVRALLDERGNKLESAGPAEPVQILGFEGTPQAGDKFVVTSTEKEAKTTGLRRQQLQREQSFRQIRMVTLDQISDRIKFGEIEELPLVIKGDVHGSIEAIADSLMKLETKEVKVNIIHKGVGAVTEGDVLLAAASNAIIIGFHIHANKKARELAKHEQVEIKSYRIIYDVVDDIKQALEGMLKPDISDEIVGEIEVRNLFKISAVGVIAGCYILDGKIERASKVKVFREGVEIFHGEIDSLKRFKEDVREVVSGFECGLKIKNFNDLKVNDIIQAYKIVETKRALLV